VERKREPVEVGEAREGKGRLGQAMRATTGREEETRVRQMAYCSPRRKPEIEEEERREREVEGGSVSEKKDG